MTTQGSPEAESPESDSSEYSSEESTSSEETGSPTTMSGLWSGLSDALSLPYLSVSGSFMQQLGFVHSFETGYSVSKGTH